MLDVNPEIICYLAEKAREFHTKEGVIIPDDTPGSSGDIASDMLAGHSDDPTYQEFKIAVEDLEPDQQVTVVALMWVGRGDFDAEDWKAALDEAGDRWTQHTAEYLISTPLLADYLEEGLSAFGYSCN